MKTENISPSFSVSDQLTVNDLETLRAAGVELIVCNRPDGEAPDQPTSSDVRCAAEKLGLGFQSITFSSGELGQHHIDELQALIKTGKKLHAYCRSGARSKQLYERAITQAISGGSNALKQRRYDVLVVGAGSAGIATAASIRRRNNSVAIGIIEPSDDHYYQPGWTMVGGGVFSADTTKKKTSDLIPAGVDWLRNKVSRFYPDQSCVELADETKIYYRHLVVAPGLELNWAAIEGLEQTLGKNGVTSNYRYDLAPYTWELVKQLKGGKAIFTQPPMPIKCAGAPQKAMYLSASEWQSTGRLDNFQIEFCNAGGVLFGVEAYVPALMSYIEKYRVKLQLSHTLIKVDGANQTAWFKAVDASGNEEIVEKRFDFLHVCPPQRSPKFIRDSSLADQQGWLDVDSTSLQHVRYPNVWGAGDVMNTANAKTMAAARKQAPVVAQNIVEALANRGPSAHYDGYGSCPLTVENGKIVLAEFGYGGKLLPSFPAWLNDGTKPSRFAWILKARVLPFVYWHAMLKGREWLASPK